MIVVQPGIAALIFHVILNGQDEIAEPVWQFLWVFLAGVAVYMAKQRVHSKIVVTVF